MEQAMRHNGVIGTGWGFDRVIRLLLVDDQPQVRRGLMMRLALEPDVEIVGEAGDAESALEMAGRLQPDVVVMDVELPGMDGIDATRNLRSRLPRTAIVMLSLHDDIDTIARATAAGAAAFIAKHRMEGPLLAAIRAAALPMAG
jgi:DNA-binding NarL/FixJ family response regulator